MAGRPNKNKNKSKAKAGANANENHSEGLAEDNMAQMIENTCTSGPAYDSNEQESKESAVGIENAGTETALEQQVAGDGAASGDKSDNAANGEAVDSSGPEGSLEGQLRLYPMAVKGSSGERIELQVNPVDSVMDLRQFLLDAPETCFYTCYDLILTAADGSKHQLADFYEIGDIADVTSGSCSLEMVNALYDDRSVRTHVRRTRDLLSTTNVHSSFSTALALENESKRVVKTEGQELEGLGFMEDPTGQLGKLIAPPSLQEIKCIESIAFSSFNPVPGFRRLLGDLIYLDIHILEGKSYCVTAHTRGFFC